MAHMLCCSSMHFALAGEAWHVDMHRGVVQGGTISASLFSLCIDAVCARLQARWQSQGRTGPLNVARVHQWLWAYADDLLLFASSVAEVKALLADVRAELSAVGLEVNLEKTQMFAAPWTVPPRYHCRAWRSTRHSCSQHRVPWLARRLRSVER